MFRIRREHLKISLQTLMHKITVHKKHTNRTQNRIEVFFLSLQITTVAFLRGLFLGHIYFQCTVHTHPQPHDSKSYCLQTVQMTVKFPTTSTVTLYTGTSHCSLHELQFRILLTKFLSHKKSEQWTNSRLLEVPWEFAQQVHIRFVDLVKACDYVHQGILWEVLQEDGLLLEAILSLSMLLSRKTVNCHLWVEKLLLQVEEFKCLGGLVHG